MKKRIISLFLAIVLLTSVSLIGVSAEDLGLKALNGIALGDSVAAFYGLEEKDGYVAQLSAILTGSGIENSFTNLAVSGYDTKALLAQLAKKDVLAQLTDADIITLNIGGNNILIPLIEVVSQELKALNITDISKASPAVMMAFATKKLSEEEMKPILEGVAMFQKDFPVIIETLHKAAPNAEVLVNTVYNPIPSLIGLYEAAEAMISSINAAMTENAKTGGYTVVDIYAAFKASNEIITNFDMTANSFDIHPNAAGHALIARAIINKLAGEPDENPANTKSDEPLVYLTRGEVISEIMNVVAPFLPKVGEVADIESEMFKDVPRNHKNFGAVMTAKASGIILGTGKGEFRVDELMTREDFAVIILRIMTIVSDTDIAGIISNTDITKVVFVPSDYSEISEYAKEAVSVAVALGIFEIEDGLTNPKGGITADFINSSILSIVK